MQNQGIELNDSRTVSLALRLFTPSRPPSLPPSRPSSCSLLRLFLLLRAVSAPLDTVAYTTAIAHATDSTEAYALLALMDQPPPSPPPSPNDVTYTALIHHLVREGDFQAGKDILFSMKAKGIPPSSVTICAILNAYLKQNRAQEALTFFHTVFPSFPPSSPPSSPPPSPPVHDLGVELDLKLQTTYLSLLLALRRPLPEIQAYVQAVESREGGREGWREGGGKIYALWAKACMAAREWKAAVRLIKVGREGGREGGRKENRSRRRREKRSLLSLPPSLPPPPPPLARAHPGRGFGQSLLHRLARRAGAGR